MDDINIFLKSDFYDYYDHWFCSRHVKPDITLERYSFGGPSRIDQFSMMEEKGIKIPEVGFVRDLYKKNKNRFVVVYIEDLHRGEGKLCLPIKEAFDKYPDYFCSVYVNVYNVSWSHRELFIGDIGVKLRYISADDDWRSNCGEVDIDFIGFLDRGYRKFEYWIYAIDYVRCEFTQNDFAVDFNISPQLWKTGIEDYFKPKEIYDSIEKFIKGNQLNGSINEIQL